MLYRMPDSNRSREERLVFLLHNYLLSRGIVLVLNCKYACVTIKIWLHLVGSHIASCRFVYIIFKTVCYRWNEVVDVVDHLISSFPIATLWTAAFTPTQLVSCHLHSHSITMSYVKETMLYRMLDSNRRGPGIPFV